MPTFYLFYVGVDGVKVVLNSRQQMPSQDMKMPRRYFRDMLANKLEMTLCDIEASVWVVPRDVLEKLSLPLEPMTMCLELGDNSIRYPMGIT
jgi:hypothetical protein